MKALTKKAMLLNHVEANGGKITWSRAIDFLLNTKGMKLDSKTNSRGHYASYFSDSVQADAIMLHPSKNDRRYLVKIARGLYELNVAPAEVDYHNDYIDCCNLNKKADKSY